MWIRFLMMGAASFFSVTAFILLSLQGVEFGHALIDFIRDLMQNKT